MKKYIIILLSAFFFQGCLKDKDTLEVADNTSRVITEFTDGDSTSLNTLAVAITPGMSSFNATEIQVLPRSVLTGDVVVTVALNQGLVDAYNMANSTNYEAPPADVFQFLTNTYTITPENKRVPLQVMIDPSLLIGEQYAVGFTITSVSQGEISVLKKDIILELKAKNEYDGNYTSNGYFYHPASPREIINRPKVLETVSPNSVVCELGDLGSQGYFALFEVDASNNVTISAYPGAAGAPYTMFTSGLPTTNPGYTPAWPGSSQCNNTYDPVAKEFRVRYGYVGATGWRVTEEIIKMD